MYLFWFSVSALCLIALFFVIWPFLRRSTLEQTAIKSEYDARMASNVRIFKERKRELSVELKSDRINQAQYDSLLGELDANLIEDAERRGQDASITDATKGTSIALASIGVVLVCASALLYSNWGSYQLSVDKLSSQFSRTELAEAEAFAKSGDTRGLLLQLRNKLRGTNGNIEGWMLLANTALNSEQFDIAAEAYRHLAELEPSPETKGAIYGLVAQAEFFKLGDIEASEVQSAIAKAFSFDSEEPNTLGLLAIYSFEQELYQDAIDYWERILTARPNYTSANAVRDGIRAAQRALGQPPVVASTGISDSDSVTNADAITVAVEISPDVMSVLSGTEQLVVFAKAVDGPPMPLAVARFPIAQFPEHINLDDSMAMMPALKMSGFEQVNVFVRITSGSVELDEGDYEVQLNNVRTNTDALLKVQLMNSDRVSLDKS